ncbi:MAG: hypothetical protein GX291_02535 [Tissierellia bacterium]|nr:hypothetical protein [Tissierellia bacterium]
MESRQRRERRRQVKKQRGSKRLLVILLLLVIGLGACSLRQILRNSPTAVTEPAMTEEGPATDESAESTEDKTEPADDETEASEQTETEDTEDATEDAAANLPDETAFETKLQGFSRLTETTQIAPEPGSDEEIKQVRIGDYVETYGTAGGFTKVSFGEVMGYLPAHILEDASVDDQFKVVEGILIANKEYGLPETYDPGIKTEVMIQFERMKDVMEAEGMFVDIGSGYRSYDYQLGVIERNIEAYGEEETRRSVAPAGHSEHQTGLAIDIINDNPAHNIVESFKDTEEGIWLADNSYRFGFILRYPEGKEDSTGYMYEPWHFRYVGEEMAARIYNSGQTLEEYFDLP